MVYCINIYRVAHKDDCTEFIRIHSSAHAAVFTKVWKVLHFSKLFILLIKNFFYKNICFEIFRHAIFMLSHLSLIVHKILMLSHLSLIVHDILMLSHLSLIVHAILMLSHLSLIVHEIDKCVQCTVYMRIASCTMYIIQGDPQNC